MVEEIPQSQASEGDSSTPELFEGFEPITANFLYCPNQFFDVCLSQCNNRGTVRIVAYVLRQTLGWVDKKGDPIEQNVTVSYEDLIRKAGVSNGAISSAATEAVALGFLRCLQAPTPHARRQPGQCGVYELCWDREGKYITDLRSFRGFYSGGGNFTPIPNQFFDEIVANEPLSTTKVVGTVIRHTIGYQSKFGQRKQLASLPHSFLASYTNLSAGKVLNAAVQSSLQKGYIQCMKQGKFDPRGRKYGSASEYAIRWRQTTSSPNNVPKSPAKTFVSERSKEPSEKPPKSPAKERSKKPSNRNTSTNNNSKEQLLVVAESQEAFGLLMQVEFGGERFNEATASNLAQSRGLDVIKRQIAWFPKRNINRNPLGGLRSAIEQDWSAPTDVQVRQRNRDNTRKENEEAAVKAAEVAEVDRLKRQHRQRRQQALPLWQSFTDEDREIIKESVYDKLNSDFDRQRFKTNADFRLQKCLDELCRREGSAPALTSPAA